MEKKKFSTLKLVPGIFGCLALVGLLGWPENLWPLILPEGLILLFPLLLCLEWALGSKKPQPIIFTALIFSGILLVTHPWWLRGTQGWIQYAAILAIFLPAVCTDIPSSLKKWPGFWLTFINLATYPLLFLSLANLSHLTASLCIALPLGVAHILKLKFENLNLLPKFSTRIILLVLLANAFVRYVPDPDEAVWQYYTLVAGLGIWALVPFCIHKFLPAHRLKVTWLVATYLISTALCIGTYLYDSVETGGGQDWDYGQY